MMTMIYDNVSNATKNYDSSQATMNALLTPMLKVKYSYLNCNCCIVLSRFIDVYKNLAYFIALYCHFMPLKFTTGMLFKTVL